MSCVGTTSVMYLDDPAYLNPKSSISAKSSESTLSASITICTHLVNCLVSNFMLANLSDWQAVSKLVLSVITNFLLSLLLERLELLAVFEYLSLFDRLQLQHLDLLQVRKYANGDRLQCESLC